MSFTPILVKLSDREIGPNATVFWREAIAFILLGAIEGSLFLKNSRLENQQDNEQTPKNKQTKTTIGLLVVTGIVATAYIMLWMWALNLTTVTNSTIIDCWLPIFTTLGGWLFLGQVFDRAFLIGMAIAIGGMLTIGFNDFSQTMVKIYGDLLALLGIGAYGTYYLLVERLREEFSTKTILLWRCGIGTVILLPILFVTGDRIFPHSSVGWLLVMSLAFFSQFIAQGLTIYCLKKLSSGFVALSMLVIPVLSAIEAGIILSERASMLNFIGGALVLLGMYVAISASQGAIKE